MGPDLPLCRGLWELSTCTGQGRTIENGERCTSTYTRKGVGVGEQFFP